MRQDGRVDFDWTGNRVAVLATWKHSNKLYSSRLDASFKENAQRRQDSFPEMIASSEQYEVGILIKFNRIVLLFGNCFSKFSVLLIMYLVNSQYLFDFYLFQ